MFRFQALFILHVLLSSIISESKLEKAKLEAKEALAKQIKVSLEFEIEQVGVSIWSFYQTCGLSGQFPSLVSMEWMGC